MFRGHVRRCPERHARAGHTGGRWLIPAGRAIRRARRFHQPQIRDFNAALIVEQQVIGFDIPVNDATLMRMRKSAGGLQDIADGDFAFESPFDFEVIRERAAGDILHAEIAQAAGFTDVIDLDDIGVTQLRGGERLAGKPRDEHRIAGPTAGHDFDRNRPVERELPGEIDRPHATATKRLFKAISGDAAGCVFRRNGCCDAGKTRIRDGRGVGMQRGRWRDDGRGVGNGRARPDASEAPADHARGHPDAKRDPAAAFGAGNAWLAVAPS